MGSGSNEGIRWQGWGMERASRSGGDTRILSSEWRETGSLSVVEKEQVPPRMTDWPKGPGRVKG